MAKQKTLLPEDDNYPIFEALDDAVRTELSNRRIDGVANIADADTIPIEWIHAFMYNFGSVGTIYSRILGDSVAREIYRNAFYFSLHVGTTSGLNRLSQALGFQHSFSFRRDAAGWNRGLKLILSPRSQSNNALTDAQEAYVKSAYRFMLPDYLDIDSIEFGHVFENDFYVAAYSWNTKVFDIGEI